MDPDGLAKQRELVEHAKATAAPPAVVPVSLNPGGRASLGGQVQAVSLKPGRKRARDGDLVRFFFFVVPSFLYFFSVNGSLTLSPDVVPRRANR